MTSTLCDKCGKEFGEGHLKLIVELVRVETPNGTKLYHHGRRWVFCLECYNQTLLKMFGVGEELKP